MKFKLLAFLSLLSGSLFSQEMNKKIDEYINYIETNNGGIGSLSIYKNSQEVYNRSFGQDKLIGVHYNKNTEYHIASVTKMVTAILVFKLIENDKLKLDTKLSDFYPEIPNSKVITIKNMLEHTSGLGNFAIKDGVVWVTQKVSEQEVFDEIKRQGVSFQPNEKVVYSNSAYLLLRMIIEKIYNTPYNKIVEQEIIKPLKLKNFASVKSNPKNTFNSYKFTENWTEIKDIEYSNVIGVGDISSTTKDMNILINNLFQNKLVKRETLEIMKPIGKDEWGRGLALYPFKENIFYGHSGDVLGSHSIALYNEKDKISISYSTNGERIPTNTFIEVLINIIYDKEFKLPEIK
ncbi:serine hydrolase domain-containing protein [Flavobacterium johnsoniae]|jgi:D-alanyl-D-alanine carboxypeptidase|uniref:Beta-lactamase n=1 Tax=Flavobacterium johnsoniae (strain ATCC 17061 / DSM 2064 / JCM 8514 / BCRC 14874 / CCUG 350202 / NBRC 14942 / NCIMB 11054 / UW101) TaxID=376686 RepID=A5FI36_FLAJ1|nr:serine hydrolase domain-containing protein [Flavobacterium johnsoniae]ABQ05135.1 beta-lactamase [Flavobacterium johnsoniae UW101]OXG00293.1 serine hydrolase [Flavobacterium johnsoniae UW101]WQG83062.1 serine hydrolase domain-containing protein [Flavobacterium johnsoniae UW101]SHL92807.1 D-alanyl-D-alanine carboxypeptidase [Flavobacterium johnsoniae]